MKKLIWYRSGIHAVASREMSDPLLCRNLTLKVVSCRASRRSNSMVELLDPFTAISISSKKLSCVPTPNWENSVTIWNLATSWIIRDFQKTRPKKLCLSNRKSNRDLWMDFETSSAKRKGTCRVYSNWLYRKINAFVSEHRTDSTQMTVASNVSRVSEKKTQQATILRIKCVSSWNTTKVELVLLFQGFESTVKIW